MNILLYFYLQWHITNKCHGKCDHCYIDNYTGEVSIKDALLILKDFKELIKIMEIQKPIISITCGDPLMHTHFWEILTEAKKLTKRIRVLGNPELITLATANKLKGIEYYQLSLDGNQKIHDKIRYKNSFWLIGKATKLLKKAGIPIVYNTTVQQVNENFLMEIETITKDFKANLWHVSKCINHNEVCSEQFGNNCNIGNSTLTVLPDNTVMACRRIFNSVLGKWSIEFPLGWHLAANPKMKPYSERR